MALNSEETLILVAACLGGATFATLITFMIARCLGFCTGYFDRLFPKVTRNSKGHTKKDSVACPPAYQMTYSKIPSFKVPGMVNAHMPPALATLNERKNSPASSLTSDDLSTDSDSIDGKDRKISSGLLSMEKLDVPVNTYEVQPKLYQFNRNRTLGGGSLGKMRFSLQYEDRSERNVRLVLDRIENLCILRQNIVHVFISLVMMPDREIVKKSSLQRKASQIDYDEEFVFASRAMNRDFKARSLWFRVILQESSGKYYDYGEARFPLLSRDIYCQVKTDISLNVKGALAKNEVGDMMVELSYSRKTELLSVAIKAIKFQNRPGAERTPGLYFRSYVTINGKKSGNKQSLYANVTPSGLSYLYIPQHADFFIKRDHVTEAALRITVISKQKVLRKHIKIGRVDLGNKCPEEAGIVHWQRILLSPDLVWTVWHPIRG